MDLIAIGERIRQLYGPADGRLRPERSPDGQLVWVWRPR